MTLSRIFAAAFAASMLTASAALAEMPRTMRLEVKHAAGAEACPRSERVRESLAVAAGVDPIDPSARARLVVTLAAGADLARGRWELYGADGAKLRERSATVTGSCSQLVAELALSFAVAWEVVPCNCDTKVHDARHEELLRILLKGYGGGRMDVHAVVMAGGLLSAGLTADPGGGFFVGGEAAGEILRGALEVRVLFPSRVVAQPTNFEYSYTAVTAALVPCARWKVLLGCAFVDVGMLIAGGNVSFADSPVIATLGLGPRLAVHVPFVEHFAIRAFADLRFAPVPSTSQFVDTGAKWQSEVVSGLFGVGLAFE